MELIPGLPNDVALDCLIRTQYSDFSSMTSVSKSWNELIQLPDFLRHRKLAGTSRVTVAMAQAVIDPNRATGTKRSGSPPAYRVTLLQPETGSWSELPPLPGHPDGLPMFCRLAGVGSELVVLGGWDPKTFGVSRSVFIYSFISATWRRGADMPLPARSFFGCAVDGERRVLYVAGGHDEVKNALKSVLAYDVAKDEWTSLTDMATERDECHAVFQRGKLHVIGGYCTDKQGKFEKSAEALDLSTMKWEPANAEFLDVATCHKSCFTNGEDVYTCRNGYVAVQMENGKWKNVAELPSGLGDVAYATSWRDKMLVVGSANGGDTSTGHVIDLGSLTWSEVGMPEEFTGNIHAGCCLVI